MVIKISCNQCREALQKTLISRSGGALDPRAIAEATLGIWEQIAFQLKPVIGSRGVDVIFLRAVDMTSISFPWLVLDEGDEKLATLLANLKVLLADREAEASAKASIALLVTFTDLLATLIGESLAERLLLPVWESLSPASKQESRS